MYYVLNTVNNNTETDFNSLMGTSVCQLPAAIMATIQNTDIITENTFCFYFNVFKVDYV